jgi:hypothetical protein
LDLQQDDTRDAEVSRAGEALMSPEKSTATPRQPNHLGAMLTYIAQVLPATHDCSEDA